MICIILITPCRREGRRFASSASTPCRARACSHIVLLVYAMPLTAPTFAAFTVVGVGMGYSLVDASFANAGSYMRVLPEGLLLPSYMDISCKVAQLLVALSCGLVLGSGYSPTSQAYRNFVFAILGTAITAAIAESALWRVSSVFVILPTALAATVAAFSQSAVSPLAVVFFDESVVTALITGNGVGAMVAGLLGILHDRVAEFSSTALLLVVAFNVAVSTVCWHVIHQRGLAMSSSSLPRYASKQPKLHGESSTLLAQETATDCRAIASTAWVLWVLQGMDTTATWGINFPTLQFAAAAAACDCDAASPAVSHVYTLATSTAFILMPFGALLALAFPTYSLRTLTALCCMQAALAIVHLCQVAVPGFGECSFGAKVMVVLIAGVLRCTDTYVTILLLQLNARMFAAQSHGTQTAAALAIGQVGLWSGLSAGTLFFGLAQSRVMACRLGEY